MATSLEAAISNNTAFGRDEGHQSIKKISANDLKNSQTFSLEMNPYESGTDRTYPSVRDYYNANVSEKDKPIQLQHGLANFSGLKLGDDRISLGESVLSATYRLPVEHLMAIDSPSKNMEKTKRKREYQAALKKVGELELNRLERVMKDKLFQRSYATSSPFQVRKAFKFFDREHTLSISIEGFTRALEFLGFQFAELQNLALFARYDTNCSGTIPYMEFISTAMFYPSVEPDFGQAPATPATVITDVKDAPDLDDETVATVVRETLKEIFDKVDLRKTGTVDAARFDLLTMALGYPEVDSASCLRDMGVQDELSFDLFLDWWTDSMGAAALRRHK